MLSKNRIKIKLFTVIIFCLSASVSAQVMQFGNIEIDFCDTLPKEMGNIMTIAGELEGFIHALSRTREEFFFQTFDSKSKRLISSKLFRIQRDYEIRDYVIFGKKIFLMLSSYDDVSKQYHFIAKEIKENLVINSAIILSIETENRSEKGDFLFKKSNDGSKYLITHVYKDFMSTNMKYSLVLVDDNLNAIHTDNNVLSTEEIRIRSLKLSDTKFNENGDFFLVYIESERDKRKKNQYNNVTIYSYQASNNFNRKEIHFEIQDYYLNDCTVIPTKNNKLHLVGFYSSLRKSGKPQWYNQGIFDIVVNNDNGEIIKKNYNPFPDFIYKLNIGRAVKKGKGLWPGWFKNIAFIERDNGGIIVLIEKNQKTEPSTFGVWPLGWTSYYFESEHVILMALASNGNLNWTKVLPKIQSMSIEVFGIQLFPSPNYTRPSSITFPLVEIGTGEEYLSVLPIYESGKLTVFYNDHYKSTVDEPRILQSLNTMKTVAYSYDDETGEATRYDFDQFQKGQLNLKPLIKYRVSNDKFLIYGGNKEGNALGTLKIKE